jgi:hypothetical protein
MGERARRIREFLARFRRISVDRPPSDDYTDDMPHTDRTVGRVYPGRSTIRAEGWPLDGRERRRNRWPWLRPR